MYLFRRMSGNNFNDEETMRILGKSVWKMSNLDRLW